MGPQTLCCVCVCVWDGMGWDSANIDEHNSVSFSSCSRLCYETRLPPCWVSGPGSPRRESAGGVCRVLPKPACVWCVCVCENLTIHSILVALHGSMDVLFLYYVWGD